jgi:predicted Fe-Mo cluster-binding NifX family protein
MRVAVPLWQGRISPVFDVARRVRIVEAENGRITSQVEYEICTGNRSKELADLEVKVLICGAITRALEITLWEAGIDVISRIRGPVDEVLQAYLMARLNQKRFTMPGRDEQLIDHKPGSVCDR